MNKKDNEGEQINTVTNGKNNNLEDVDMKTEISDKSAAAVTNQPKRFQTT